MVTIFLRFLLVKESSFGVTIRDVVVVVGGGGGVDGALICNSVSLPSPHPLLDETRIAEHSAT